MPIGIASAIGRTERHLDVWTRPVRDTGVARRSVIIDRGFMSACPGQRRASLNSAALSVAQTMIQSSSGNSSPGSASRGPSKNRIPPPRRLVDSPSPPTFRTNLKKFMQLASSFCRSYRCKALTRGMRNHWLGSSLDSRVATMRGTPKVAISCRLSVKEVGHSSFRLHFSSFPQAVSILTFDHAKPRSAHLKPDCDNSFDGSIMFQVSYGKKTDHRHRRFCAGLSGRLWTFDRRRPFVLRPSDVPPTPHPWQIQCFRQKHPKRRLVTLSKTNHPENLPSHVSNYLI